MDNRFCRLSCVLTLVALVATLGVARNQVEVRLSCSLGTALAKFYESGGDSEASHEIANAMCADIQGKLEDEPRTSFWNYRVVNDETPHDVFFGIQQEDLDDARYFTISFSNPTLSGIRETFVDASVVDPPRPSMAGGILSEQFYTKVIAKRIEDLHRSLQHWPLACSGWVEFDDDSLPWAVSRQLTLEQHAPLELSSFAIEAAGDQEMDCTYLESFRLLDSMMWTQEGHRPHTLDLGPVPTKVLALLLGTDVTEERELHRFFLARYQPVLEFDLVDAHRFLFATSAVKNSEAALASGNRADAFSEIHSALRVYPDHEEAQQQAIELLSEESDMQIYAYQTGELVNLLANSGVVSGAMRIFRPALSRAASEPTLANTEALGTSLLTIMAQANFSVREYASSWERDVDLAWGAATDDTARSRMEWTRALYSDPLGRFTVPPVESDLLPLASAAAQASGRAFLEEGQLTAAHQRFLAAWEFDPSFTSAAGLLAVTGLAPETLDPGAILTGDVVDSLGSDTAWNDFEARGVNLLASNVYAGLGLFERAEGAVLAAIKRDETIASSAPTAQLSPRLYDELATIRQNAGNTDGAFEAWSRAYRLYAVQDREDRQMVIRGNLKQLYQFDPEQSDGWRLYQLYPEWFRGQWQHYQLEPNQSNPEEVYMIDPNRFTSQRLHEAYAGLLYSRELYDMEFGRFGLPFSGQ